MTTAVGTAPPDFGTLQLRRLMVHEIPRAYRGDDNAPLGLSDGESILEPAVVADLQARLRELLARTSRPIVEDTTVGSPVPGLIRDHLGGGAADRNEDDFVDTTQWFARHLRTCQTGSNSGGLLMAADVVLDGRPALLLVKLEHAKGIRGSRRSRDGRTRFAVKRIADLLFTDRANVYKLAVVKLPDGDGDDADGDGDGAVVGHAADPQTAGRRLADFFLGDFLGCRYAQDPDVLTQRFRDATAEWINSDDVPDPATRTRYAVALLAEINSARPQVSVREFAREHLAADDRDPYRRAMADAGVPAAAFPKDLALVNNRSTVQMNFESRTYLVTTRDAFAEGIVQVDEDSDPHGTAAVHIRDRLTSVKGRGAPGRRTPPGTQRPASADDRP